MFPFFECRNHTVCLRRRSDSVLCQGRSGERQHGIATWRPTVCQCEQLFVPVVMQGPWTNQTVQWFLGTCIQYQRLPGTCIQYLWPTHSTVYSTVQYSTVTTVMYCKYRTRSLLAVPLAHCYRRFTVLFSFPIGYSSPLLAHY